MKYCVVCNWSISTDEGYSKTECSDRAIDHYLTTGHEIDSDSRALLTQHATPSWTASQQSTIDVCDGLQDRTGYDPMTETYHTQHDWMGTDSLDVTIRKAVAALTGKEPCNKSRLSDTLDLNALNTLFHPTRTSTSWSAGRVSFTLDTHEVTIHADGDIVISPPENRAMDTSRTTLSEGDKTAHETRNSLETDTHQARYDWATSDSLSTTVVSTIATVAGKEPTELKPLFDQLDPDALDALFQPTDDALRVGGQVAFIVDDYQVTVHANGKIVSQGANETSSLLTIEDSNGE